MNVDHTSTPEPVDSAAEQVRVYRNERRRRHRVQAASSKYDRRVNEREIIIGLAQRWLPYGGPPEEEIFQLFGIRRHQYVELLWDTIRRVEPEGELAAQLAPVYRRRGW